MNKIDRHCEIAKCLVVGCDGLAMYRNRTSACGGTERGYCKTHRAQAVSRQDPEWVEAGISRLIAFIDTREREDRD